jgi:hypothetical protein
VRIEARRLRLIVAAACCAGFLIVPTVGHAATLYGATGGKGDDTVANSGILYTIDSATGAATAVGPIGFGVTGLAVDPTTGVLYGSTTTISATDPNSIITINKRTGAGTLVGPTGRSSGLADIAFDASGQLWGWGADTPLDLETVDKTTGAATSVGGSGSFGEGMSFDGSGTLFGMFNGDDGELSTVDTSNGDLTTVATLSGSPFGDRAIPAASFGCDGSTLYAIDGLEHSPPLADLVTVDTTTAAITDIGPTTNQMDGLAWDCVPPPGSLYGATGGTGDHAANSGILFLLDPATGVATTTIGPIGFGITGLAVDPTTGILYGSTSSNSSTDADSIVTINKATGAGTLVGPTGEASAVADIAFDSSGQLWGWSEAGDFFVSIDKTTGAATHEAHTSSAGDGMSFDRNDVPYIMINGDDGDLRTIDTATGNTTFVANLSGSPYGDRTIPAASFACDGTTLFALDGLTSTTPHGLVSLVTVNTGSGVIAERGQTTDSMDGLAFDCFGFVAPSGGGGGGGGAPSPPIVTAVSPSSGPAGTSVGITGQHFENVTQVLFGSTPATFVIDGFNHLTAVAPAGPAGGVDVHVVTGNGTSPSTAADVFNYTTAGGGGGGGGTPPAAAKCPHVPNLNHRTLRGARKYMDRAGCNVSLKLANHLPRKHHKRRRVVSQTPASGSSTDGAVTVTMGYLKALKKG